MKIVLTSLFLAICTIAQAQAPSYYNDVDLNLTGAALQSELSDKVTTTQSNTLSYTPGVWDALKQTDLVPGGNGSSVILIYGYSDTDGVVNTDRTRGVNQNGGGTTDWNREHVYPKSLGNPNLGTSGPGADAHHLRAADVSRNSSRGNRKFADGSGNSAITAQGHWYPGDEFKGDVARMVLFMYLRYGNRCLPSNVGVGSTNATDANMIDLFLEWNAEDPVSELETQRNPIIENLQGNRNPFIDNPAFATSIWGGPQAEDLFGNTGGGGGGNTLCGSTVSNFPYSESFESNFGNWVQANASDDFDWERRSGGTPSSNTGPGSASDGSQYIYLESSSPNYSAKRAILYGPCFDLSGASQADLSFKYHLYGSSSMGSLTLEASLDGTSWTSVWSKSGNQGNSWQTADVDLGTYTGQSVQLRLNGLTGTTWQGDMAVDDLELITSGGGGSGGGPTAANLRITFDNYPEETSWLIRNGSNVTVASGGTYGSQTDGSTLNIPVSLPDGCYTLIFSDSYGDGICCSYGNGSYVLTNTSSGATLASGGSFGSTDTKVFCVGTSSLAADVAGEVNAFQATQFQDLTFFPNPATAAISVRTSARTTYVIASQTGRVVQQGVVRDTIDLSKLARGSYFLTLSNETNTITRILMRQ